MDTGYTEIFLKLRADYSSIRATLKLWNAQEFNQRKISFWESEKFQYIITGFMLFAAFLATLLFINYRAWVYMGYSLFVLLNISMVYTIKGWIIPYLHWFTFYTYDLRALTNSLVIAISTWYFYLLIPIQYSSAVIRKVFIFFISVVAFSFITSILIPNNIKLYTFYFYLLKPILIIAAPVAIFHFAYAVKKGYSIA